MNSDNGKSAMNNNSTFRTLYVRNPSLFDQFDTSTAGIDKLKIAADTFKDPSYSILRAPRLAKNRDDLHQPALWLANNAKDLYFTRTSRDLKRIDVCVADTETGKVKTLVEERLNTYVETRDLGLVNQGEELIHWSERDG